MPPPSRAKRHGGTVQATLAALLALATALAGCTAPEALQPARATGDAAHGAEAGAGEDGRGRAGSSAGQGAPGQASGPTAGNGGAGGGSGDAAETPPVVEAFHFEGRFQCSATYLIVNGDCMALPDSVARGHGVPVRPGDLTEDENAFHFPLRAGWLALQMTLAWRDAAASVPPTETDMRLALEPADAPDAHAARYAAGEGASPLVLSLEPGLRHPDATHERPLPVAEATDLRAVVYATGALGRTGGTQLLGVGARVDQAFTLEVQVVYPGGSRGVADEDAPTA